LVAHCRSEGASRVDNGAGSGPRGSRGGVMAAP